MLPRRALVVLASAPLLLAVACGEVTRAEPNKKFATPNTSGPQITPTVGAAPSPTEAETSQAASPTGSPGGDSSPSGSPKAPGGGGTEVVATVDNKFEPATLEVKAGTEVTWTNAGGFHTVTGGEDAPDPASPIGDNPLADTNAVVKKKFDKPGTYSYFCQPHLALGMKGEIVVK